MSRHPASVVVYVNDPYRHDGAGARDMHAVTGPVNGPPGCPNGARPALMAAHAAHAARAGAAAADVTDGPIVAGVPDAAPRFDPGAAHRDFPSLWQAYIRANYRSYAEITRVFGVCERTARKWMDGETGCNGRQLSRAFRQHPDQVADLMDAVV